jgi:hypothetical protein
MSEPHIVSGLRPSDKDRNDVLAILAAAYGDGRIGKAEHETRVIAAQMTAAQQDLDRLVTDLPPAEVSRSAIRKAHRLSWRQGRLAAAKKASGISWAWWQASVAGSLALGATGVFLILPMSIFFSKTLPQAVMPLAIGGDIIGGLLLIVIAITSVVWLYDIQEVKTGRKSARGRSLY